VGAECPVDPVRWSFAATLVYDWNTGNLSAEIPAAVLNDGWPTAPNYEKIYTINGLSIDSRLLPYEKMDLNPTVLGWSEQDGPLERIAAGTTLLLFPGQVVWLPNGLLLPGSWPPSVRPAAAVVDLVLCCLVVFRGPILLLWVSAIRRRTMSIISTIGGSSLCTSPFH